MTTTTKASFLRSSSQQRSFSTSVSVKRISSHESKQQLSQQQGELQQQLKRQHDLQQK